MICTEGVYSMAIGRLYVRDATTLAGSLRCSLRSHDPGRPPWLASLPLSLSLYMCIYIYIHTPLSLYIYIYIWLPRERTAPLAPLMYLS